MPVEIIPTVDEAAKANVVVCLRVADLPIPYRPATIQNCLTCNERIWVADDSPKRVPCYCWPCTKDQIAKDGEEPTLVMTKAQHDRYGQEGANLALKSLMEKL